MQLLAILSCSGLLLACGSPSTQGSSGAPVPATPDSRTHHAKDHEHRAGYGGGMHGQHRFENAEEWVDRFEGPERDAWQKPALVVASMSILEGMVVADIGAGTGYFLPHLVAAVGPNGKVVGIDIEPDMVRYMSERIAREGLQPAIAQVGSPDDPGLAQRSTDRILIVDTWHHIEDRAGYSRKLADALAPAGRVYIVDFSKESPHGPPAEFRLSAAEVIAELEAGGMQAEAIEVDLPYQWVVRAQRGPLRPDRHTR